MSAIANSRTSDRDMNAGYRGRAAWRALVYFEWRQQWRDPLTSLYALIFLLLPFGYLASDAVALVSDRGGAPKHAPAMLALAFGGLTAFGQVITTMIATTALLRDDALRVRALVATSGVRVRTWYVAQVTAAVLVMLMVYAAMPVGAALGAVVAGDWPPRGVLAFLTPFVMITLPTVIVVALLLSAAAAVTRRVLGVLAVALLLVGCWQLSLALEVREGTRILGALLDPFANAPVLAVTRAWGDAERGTMALGIPGLLLANRVVWLSVALSVSAVTWWRISWLAPSAPPRLRDAPQGAPSPMRASRVTSAFSAVRHLTASWILRDGGWRIVALLAVANALANAWTRAASAPAADVLPLVSTHARIFLILLATVYAGEVVWRERDVRVAALVDTAPISRRTAACGRLVGLLQAQSVVVLALALGALLVSLWRGASLTEVAPAWMAWSLFVLWLPFVQLTVLSTAIHVLLNHKVLAHLLLILGWVLAVTLNQQGASAWWYRFAEPGPLRDAQGVAWWALAQRGAYWSAVSAALVGIVIWWWPRATAATSQR